MNALIVEDDPLLSKNIKDMLASEGFNMDTAFDGLMAEKMLKKRKYDIVVLDINIPQKNGYEVCKVFRQYDDSTPVLFLTAFDELEDKIQGFECGGDDYLTKPFFMKELLLRIQSLIKRTRQPVNDNAPVLIVEDIVVNQRTKSVKRNNVEIMLTPREYQILLKLVMAKGELVPKQELIKEIWGSAFDANTNTIEVYINFLRNKVDKPFGKQLIKTKIGYGYFLDVKA
jgi:two-component system, OmpR family, response regulator